MAEVGFLVAVTAGIRRILSDWRQQGLHCGSIYGYKICFQVAVLMKRVESLKAERTYTADGGDAELAREFGI